MKTARGKMLFCILSWLIFLSPLSLSLPKNLNALTSAATTVYVDPQLQRVGVGVRFTVNINISDVNNLFAYDFRIVYKTAGLNASRVELCQGHFFAGESYFIAKNETNDSFNSTHGCVWFAVSLLPPAPPKNGAGVLFTIIFLSTAVGDSSLSLGVPNPLPPPPDAYTKLSDPLPALISHTSVGGSVLVRVESHDVAVINVKPWKTVWRQNSTVRINVTVTSKGCFTETFNVITYADLALPIGDETTIGKQGVFNLLGGETRTILFQWNTTGVAKGNYTISALADTVLNETYTADNTKVDGVIWVAMVGDIIPDGIVDIFDLVALALHYGHSPPDGHGSNTSESNSCFNADINGDDIIDIFDLVLIATHYGQTDP